MIAKVKIRNKRWDWDFFLKVRKEILSQWPTGQQLMDPEALEEAVAYQKAQPWWKFVALRDAQAEKEGRIQIAAQLGHALVEQMVEQVEHCEDLKPDWWFISDDTYSRKGQFALAQEAVERSRKDGLSYLNGYPAVAHGVAGIRTINGATAACLGAPNNDEDGRLSCEIMLAGGCTFSIMQGLPTGVQRSRETPLEDMLFNAQYANRLVGYYTERGAPITGFSGNAGPGWDSAGFKVMMSLLGCVLGAEQGIKYFTPSYSQGMNVVQDVAAIHTLDKLTREYLDRFGYHDTKVHTLAGCFAGSYPVDRWALSGQLAWCFAVVALGGARTMLIRTPDEASSTPTKEGHRAAIAMAKQIVRLMCNQRLPEDAAVLLEKEMIEKEVRAVMERMLELGDGDLAVGACRAVEAGVIDTQFSPWRRLKGKVMVARDQNGAFRYLDAGNIPLPPEVKEYHRAKIAERERSEGTTAGLEWVMREPTWSSRPLQEEAAELAARLTGGMQERNVTALGAAKKQRVAQAQQSTVVLGTVGHDAHVVGSSVLRHALGEAGFNVAFLGAVVSPEEFIHAAKETNAAAIWVSSLYGMARIDCADMRAKVIEAGMGDIPMYIGGILATDPEEWNATEELFHNAGFDRVYPPGTKPETAIADLEKDLALRSSKK